MRSFGLLPALVILAGCAASASAQVSCSVNYIPGIARVEGFTEMLGDVVLECSGGTPTAAGQLVPQVNITLLLNTNVSSRIVAPASASTGNNFTEALILVDEPNRQVGLTSVGAVSHPLLNCGHAGAPDNGVLGPGVCEIQATGVPSQTYDGTPNAGAGCFSGSVVVAIEPTNAYSCGRPNAFQGVYSSSQTNEIRFVGVPFDSPGPSASHTFRITNVRADMPAYGTTPATVLGTVVITGSANVILTGNTNITMAQADKGMSVSSPTPGTIRVTEGTAGAFKARNISELPANGVYSAGKWLYTVPDKNAPVDAAQNVPGVVQLYNTEGGFQWQNASPNGPLAVNPPQGFGTGSSPGTNYPLASKGFGGVNTGIQNAGVANSGTRVAVSFVALGETVTVPQVVYLHPLASPSTTSGVMVLTTTDSTGGGPFNPSSNVTITGTGMAVYEVLFGDEFAIEYADIPVTISGLHLAEATVSLAPFYTPASGAGQAAPTVSHPSPNQIPRFNSAAATSLMLLATPTGFSFLF